MHQVRHYEEEPWAIDRQATYQRRGATVCGRTRGTVSDAGRRDLNFKPHWKQATTLARLMSEQRTSATLS
jgi:hypothetical protein